MIMARFLHRFFSELRRKSNVWILAVCFFAGLVLGIRASHEAGLSFPLMRGALKSTVSIVRLLSILLLPFLFSAIAVFLSKPWMLIVIAFCKTAVFALVSFMMLLTFGSAGWMMRGMVMFADICTLPFFFGFCWRHLDKNICVSSSSGIYLIALLLICGFDIYGISPFLTKVLHS